MPDFVETPDFLYKSSVLRRASINRTTFDPANEEHLQSLAKFIESGNWGTVQFHCEYPFSDVPMTVLMKYAGHLLGVRRKTAEEMLYLRGAEAMAKQVLAGESLLGSPTDELVAETLERR